MEKARFMAQIEYNPNSFELNRFEFVQVNVCWDFEKSQSFLYNIFKARCSGAESNMLVDGWI